MSHSSPAPMSRRHFLRGVGVALALPWLESMPLFGQVAAGAAAKTAGPPLRLGIVYFSNGVEPAHWWARGTGATMELGPALASMAPHREDMVFINGLYSQAALDSSSPHLGRMNLLSGAPVSLDPGEIRVGTTMDQVLAAQIGHHTAVPSLVLGIEPNELRLEDGLSMIYGSSLSWISPTKPATKEIYPSRAFDRLVGDGTGRQLDRSILDEVREDSAGLKRKVSRDDHVKLQEYFESIRDIEKRIERANREERLEGWRPTLAQPNLPRPANELPQLVPEHMKLMLDLTVLAFQMDKSRIATLMLNNDLSQMNFRFLQGVQGALHLDLTHNGKAADKEAMYLRTNQFHIEQFAYLTQRMKEIKEGEGTMLDHSILMMASSLFDGDAHSADRLPILLAGKGGGTLQTGRVLDYLTAGDENRKVSSLHLSLMDRMGVKLDRFGDATARLAGL
ncbi:hypothetical protein Verru16b_00320 [Lacunisphaera limnophila]|uniref:DUF1552 domain-containing protein n=1 Tax=Lacunisphaera limnophila TaxID=1838286 RepID=A0A1I7PI23_9BACT|nr:DUF1552 domain-containing protein [Lacunisphaera limnophila]AOS43277.1 hypothetical protein Verru16b_00320 [Lacunisphaera limnophila]